MGMRWRIREAEAGISGIAPGVLARRTSFAGHPDSGCFLLGAGTEHTGGRESPRCYRPAHFFRRACCFWVFYFWAQERSTQGEGRARGLFARRSCFAGRSDSGCFTFGCRNGAHRGKGEPPVCSPGALFSPGVLLLGVFPFGQVRITPGERRAPGVFARRTSFAGRSDSECFYFWAQERSTPGEGRAPGVIAGASCFCAYIAAIAQKCPAVPPMTKRCQMAWW